MRNFKGNFRTLLILPMLLTACAGGNSESCPIPKTYTEAEQDAAYVEISNLPARSELRAFMDDYHLLREEAKDCSMR